jgi:guanyl-specific ribonuclease Sa
MSYEDIKKLEAVFTYEMLTEMEHRMYAQFNGAIEDISIQVMYPGEYEEALISDGSNTVLAVNKINRNIAVGSAVIMTCAILPMVPGIGPVITALAIPLVNIALTEAAIGAAISAALEAALAYVETSGDISQVISRSIEGASEGFMMGAVFAPIAVPLASLKFLKAGAKTGKVLTGTVSKADDAAKRRPKAGTKAKTLIPRDVDDIVKKIRKGEPAPPGNTNWGKPFENRAKSLPTTDPAGKPITYREYDIDPSFGGPRNGRRIVVGSDGKIYYTSDHYNTFIDYDTGLKAVTQLDDIYKGIPRENWVGVRGNSDYKPNLDVIPERWNYEWKAHNWKEIYEGNLRFAQNDPRIPPARRAQLVDEYGRLARGEKGIPFVNGEPDFSRIAYDTVTIDNYSPARYGTGGNMDLADEALARKWGVSKQEVRKWMNENELTWHERPDMKTLDIVPHDIHGNINHKGGISEINQIEDLLSASKDGI